MLSLIWQSVERPPSGKPGEAFFLAAPSGRKAFLPVEKNQHIHNLEQSAFSAVVIHMWIS